MKKRERDEILFVFLRYLILILIAIPNLAIFYLIFKPLTIYPVLSFLSIFYKTSLYGSTIRVGSFVIGIVNACVAGSAYYLLTILNLSTPGIKWDKRLKILFVTLFSFLILNVLRIIALSLLAINKLPMFDITHKILWYLGSTVFVVAIWFLAVKLFKIEGVPFYSDLKFFYKKIRN